jgi:AmmeMemoRadiSam system protein B
MTSRSASHAGSWYDDDPAILSRKLSTWIKSTGITNRTPRLGMIVPHAGLSYCGSTAAFAWASVDVKRVERVFILGPSHHISIPGRIACTKNSIFETPLGPLKVDRKEISELLAISKSSGGGSGGGGVNFVEVDRTADENEHSIEMHLPYIKYTFDQAGNSTFTIVPLMVGSLNESMERAFATVLASRARTDGKDLIVISSDFAHWGERFGYQYIHDSKIPIYESIEMVDKMGLAHIQSKSHKDFVEYLRETHNTICGRHPIGIWLAWIHILSPTIKINVDFLAYSQSSQVKSESDSSVSYASVIFTVVGE